MVKRSLLLSALFIASLLFLSCQKIRKPAAGMGFPEGYRSEVVLGTVCTVNLFENGTTERYDEIFQRLRQIEEIFSVNLPYSQVSQVNDMAGISPVSVSREFMVVAKKSLEYARLTEGIFDPTIGPLVNLWGINTGHERLPSQSEINAVLPLINWEHLVLDEKESTAFLTEKGMALDFGAIAKGYAADEIASLLTEKEKPALIDLGGNVYLYGTKKDGSLWQVGVKNPLTREGAVAALSLGGSASVVTSGTYERFMQMGGRVYHHILDPRTGRSARPGLFSVTVVCTSSIDADALSTSLFLMGKEKALDFLEEQNRAGVLPHFEAVFIGLNHGISASGGLKDTLRLLNPEFSLTEE